MLAALASPGASSLTTAPVSALLPEFGFATQPTSNNGDRFYKPYTDDGFTWRATAAMRWRRKVASMPLMLAVAVAAVRADSAVCA